MYKLIPFLIVLTSCSSTYHLNKAIKKEPTILNTQVVRDTIQITTLDSIPYIVNDTIKYKVFEKVTDTIVEFQYKYLTAPETRQDKRLRYKENKLIKKNSLKLDKLLARLNKRTKNVQTRQENKGSKWYIFILIGILIGFLTRFIKLF
jgi:hypothetical protein